MVDWTKLRLRPGQWICNEHGAVTPYAGVVPACPDCMVGLLLVQPDGRCVEQAPPRCAGPERHRLTRETMRVGWTGCRCGPWRGHRSWTCRTCGDTQSWPPHDALAAPQYRGPGHQHYVDGR